MIGLPQFNIGSIVGVLGAWYLASNAINLVSIGVILAGWYIGDYFIPNSPLNIKGA